MTGVPKATCPVCGEFQPHACAGPKPEDKPEKAEPGKEKGS